jgi:YHS domain-containing protein
MPKPSPTALGRGGPALIETLRRHFTDDAIVELTALTAFQNMSSKFNAALGVPSQASASRPARPTRPRVSDMDHATAHAGDHDRSRLWNVRGSRERNGVGAIRGTTYYFCCDGCRKMFEAEPEKYLAKLARAAAPGTASEKATDPLCGMKVDPKSAAGPHEHHGRSYAQYTCPMHPEIVQVGPAPAPSAGWPWCRSRALARRTIPSCAISRDGCGQASRCRFRSWCSHGADDRHP